MKTAESDFLKAKREKIVVESIHRARNAMILLQGSRVTFGRKAGFLDFEKEIIKLTAALQELGLDVSLPVRVCDNAHRLKV